MSVSGRQSPPKNWARRSPGSGWAWAEPRCIATSIRRHVPNGRGVLIVGQSLLNPYKDDLVQRWNAGCRDTRQLCAELRRRGYRGSYPTVARYTQRLRQPRAAPRQRLMSQRWLAVSEPTPPLLTARRAAWLVLRRADQRTAVESQQLPSCAPSRANWRMPSPSQKTLSSSSASAKGTA